MHGITPGFSLQRGVALKWLLMAAIAMVAIATMVVAATAQAQSSNAPTGGGGGEDHAPMQQVESATCTPAATVPGPVGNLAAKQTGWISADESGSDRGYKRAVIYVTWEPPADDGGCPIIGYDVEIMRGGNGDTIGPLIQMINLKFGSANGVWKNNLETDMTDLTHTTGLGGGTIALGREGQWLEYRIGAANELGAGEIKKVQIQVEEHTVPGPVGNLAAKQTGWIAAAESSTGYKRAVIYVTWEPPADDGGRPIIGYDLEIMRGGNDNTIGPLTQLFNYKFGSDNGVWKNNLETDMTDLTHTTGLGGTVVLGREGQWLEYRIGAANTLGAGEITKVQIQVEEHTVPGPVRNLAAKQTGWIPAAESGDGYDQAVISVTWEPPADDGGRPVTGYDLEIMSGGNGNAIGALTQEVNYKVGSDNGVWKNGEETDMTDLAHTTGIIAGTSDALGRDNQWIEYRIGAVNTLGAGEITKVQIQVEEHTVPGPVGNLAAKQTGWIPADESSTGYDRAVISVTWEPPADDGGRPVTGYDLEIMSGGNGNAISTSLAQEVNYKVGSDNGVWKNDREADMTDLTHTTGIIAGTSDALGRDNQWIEYRIGAANTLGAGEITKVQVQVDQEVRDVIFVEVVKDGTVYGNSKGLQNTINVTEGDSGITTVPIQVRLTGRPSADVNVRFMFQKPNDTEVQGRRNARANRAFHYMHLTLTWAANASGADLTKTLNLKIVGDTTDEDNEVVRLRVQEIRGTDISSDDRVKISRTGKKHSIRVVIVDDDGE